MSHAQPVSLAAASASSAAHPHASSFENVACVASPATRSGLPIPRWIARPGAAVLAVALAAQALLVASHGGIRPSPAILLLAGIGAALFAAAWARWTPPAWVELAVATAALGGLGMALGSLIDAAGAANAHGAHHHPPAQHGFALLSWSTGLMLLLCLPACGRACAAACHGTATRLMGHGGVCLAMVGGMYAASLLSAPGAASAHLLMLGGMTAGTLAATALLVRITAPVLVHRT
jgi:hypothetical protein